MKNKFVFLLFINYCSLIVAQEAFHNFGSVQIHETAQVGLHLDLINDGVFDQNLGLLGLYGIGKSLRISGANVAIFNDIEIIVDETLNLDTSLGAQNNVNFISGNIITQKDISNNSLDFLDVSFYNGAGTSSMVDGFSGIINKETFTFPVGDNTRYSPLTINSIAINSSAKCAYYYEDPNNPDSLPSQFDTQNTSTEFLSISNNEFWKLEGDLPSYVTLLWDSMSNIETLGETLSDLKVVGWSKADNLWVNLGNTEVNGSISSGSITSDLFIPNDYNIITLGGNRDDDEDLEDLELGNYYVNPNGDGENDFLVIEGIEEYPDNNIEIYNRYGVLVYKLENYANQFDGRANVSLTIKRDSGLESGVYFYILTLNELRKKHQGYLYLANPK
ncbi:gliding motility-associated C-terminal domain-containing protein [Eudoraea chungangensis]|uniref:gliding motility-associated C-terminal domain-containing protein n=1 Tax=Eudoraea chungangensis TaxID=1481905 RepID=UPI0023EBC860|nr:gliding motility-associated C-terminal domain-containing protein [Eudoraea chungangensis]